MEAEYTAKVQVEHASDLPVAVAKLNAILNPTAAITVTQSQIDQTRAKIAAVRALVTTFSS